MLERALEVFGVFFRLGLRSFGGPIAHLGYFREEFVVRRRWIEESAFAELVGLCQFLPGPTSSQVGFSLGLMRAGYRGALAAWLGFTLPSAALLVLFALGAPRLHSHWGVPLLHGLRLVALPIVAQAVATMARALTPDLRRIGIAVLAAAVVLLAPGTLAQLSALLLGAALGLILCRQILQPGALSSPFHGSRVVATFCLASFWLLLLACMLFPLLDARGSGSLFGAFYRSGALVFGGGHVVLPLLRDALVKPGWVSDEAFLAGYGAAQAMPGPLFSLGAYLGFVATSGPHGLAGAALGLTALFLPGILLLLAALPYWGQLQAAPALQSAFHGVQAAVVGVLAAALYDPIWKNSVHSFWDFVLALIALALLVLWRLPALLVVLVTALGAVAAAADPWALLQPLVH
jgi:chromate transporter